MLKQYTVKINVTVEAVRDEIKSHSQTNLHHHATWWTQHGNHAQCDQLATVFVACQPSPAGCRKLITLSVHSMSACYLVGGLAQP